MKSFRKYILLGILFFIINGLKAQSHLEPVRSIYDLFDFQVEYYSKVRTVLFDGMTGSPVTRFLILPSFSPESVLAIERDEEDGSYYLIYHECNKKIWYNEKWQKVKVQKDRKYIFEESADIIIELYNTAISKTKFPENQTQGLDGTDYYFSIFDLGWKSGTVWSPDENSAMDELVSINYELIKLLKTKETFIELNEDLKNRILELTKTLK